MLAGAYFCTPTSGIITGMANVVFLERVRDADVSIARCSICKEEFHSSPVGPRKCMSEFPDHVKEKHPEAGFNRKPWELFCSRTGE